MLSPEIIRLISYFRINRNSLIRFILEAKFGDYLLLLSRKLLSTVLFWDIVNTINSFKKKLNFAIQWPA